MTPPRRIRIDSVAAFLKARFQSPAATPALPALVRPTESRRIASPRGGLTRKLRSGGAVQPRSNGLEETHRLSPVEQGLLEIVERALRRGIRRVGRMWLFVTEPLPFLGLFLARVARSWRATVKRAHAACARSREWPPAFPVSSISQTQIGCRAPGAQVQRPQSRGRRTQHERASTRSTPKQSV